jgi:hypothetical protein
MCASPKSDDKIDRLVGAIVAHQPLDFIGDRTE